MEILRFSRTMCAVWISIPILAFSILCLSACKSETSPLLTSRWIQVKFLLYITVTRLENYLSECKDKCTILYPLKQEPKPIASLWCYNVRLGIAGVMPKCTHTEVEIKIWCNLTRWPTQSSPCFEEMSAVVLRWQELYTKWRTHKHDREQPVEITMSFNAQKKTKNKCWNARHWWQRRTGTGSTQCRRQLRWLRIQKDKKWWSETIGEVSDTQKDVKWTWNWKKLRKHDPSVT